MADSLVTAAASGDRLEALIALRSILAEQISTCESARDVAALSLRFTDVLADIAAVEKTRVGKKGTPLDELAQRRVAGKGVAAR